MITAPALSDSIASDAFDLHEAYPKGATSHDLAGWYAVPLPRIEEALATLREEGADLSFLRQEPEKNPAAVAMGQRGGRARAEKVDAERRAEIAREAANKRWGEQSQLREQRLAMGRASRSSAGRGSYKPKDADEPSAGEVRQRLIDMLPKLAKSYPEGIVFEQLIFDLGVSAHRGRYVIQQAKNEGWCDIIRERISRCRVQTYLFPGMMKRAPQLTERQADVYNWLKAHAKGDEVTAKMNQICRDLKVSDGTVFGHLYAIEKKEYIERLTGYNERVNGVRISPRFRLLEIAAPSLVKMKKPPVKALSETPEPEPPKRVEGFPPKRGQSKLLDDLKAHRQRLEDELARIEAIIANYFSP